MINRNSVVTIEIFISIPLDENKSRIYRKKTWISSYFFSATLRLNRIVKQRVIVGHYKPVAEVDNVAETEEKTDKKNEDKEKDNDTENTDSSEADSDNKDVRKRTVVVIPVDNPEIGEIPVNVCEGDVLTIYESLVNIKSVTEAREMVQENLCLDFEVKPGMKLLATDGWYDICQNIKS